MRSSPGRSSTAWRQDAGLVSWLKKCSAGLRLAAQGPVRCEANAGLLLPTFVRQPAAPATRSSGHLSGSVLLQRVQGWLEMRWGEFRRGAAALDRRRVCPASETEVGGSAQRMEFSYEWRMEFSSEWPLEFPRERERWICISWSWICKFTYWMEKFRSWPKLFRYSKPYR
jgi:hypothetical protein